MRCRLLVLFGDMVHTISPQFCHTKFNAKDLTNETTGNYNTNVIIQDGGQSLGKLSVMLA